MIGENFLALHHLYDLLRRQLLELEHDFECYDTMILEHFRQNEVIKAIHEACLTFLNLFDQVLVLLSEKAFIVCKFSNSLLMDHLVMYLHQTFV